MKLVKLIKNEHLNDFYLDYINDNAIRMLHVK